MNPTFGDILLAVALGLLGVAALAARIYEGIAWRKLQKARRDVDAAIDDYLR